MSNVARFFCFFFCFGGFFFWGLCFFCVYCFCGGFVCFGLSDVHFRFYPPGFFSVVLVLFVLCLCVGQLQRNGPPPPPRVGEFWAPPCPFLAAPLTRPPCSPPPAPVPSLFLFCKIFCGFCWLVFGVVWGWCGGVLASVCVMCCYRLSACWGCWCFLWILFFCPAAVCCVPPLSPFLLPLPQPSRYTATPGSEEVDMVGKK